MTDKKPYIDILMLGFFDRIIVILTGSVLLAENILVLHAVYPSFALSLGCFLMLCLSFFLVSLFVEYERAINFLGKCKKKKAQYALKKK